MTLDDDPAERSEPQRDRGVVGRRHGALVEKIGGVVQLDAVEDGELVADRRERLIELARDRSGRRRPGNRPAPEIAVDASEGTLGADQEEGEEALGCARRAAPGRALALDERPRSRERVERRASAERAPDGRNRALAQDPKWRARWAR
jgi:hypothetical protein